MPSKRTRRSFGRSWSAVDPRLPWKMPRLGWPRYGHGFIMRASEWKTLLAQAQQGDAIAEWEISQRYEDGCKAKSGKILAKRSLRRSAEWLRRAAEHGCASAQNNLGLLFGDGKGVNKNLRESLAWLRKAFNGEDSYVATNIAITHRQNGSFGRAVLWFKKAVALGDDDARVQLGIHYYWGKRIKRNPAAAVRCLRRATTGKNICEYGRDNAFFYLGIAYFEGKGVKASIRKAKKLFERANIDNDHPAARRMLRKLAGQ
jgi:TPR repeat protein